MIIYRKNGRKVYFNRENGGEFGVVFKQMIRKMFEIFENVSFMFLK